MKIKRLLAVVLTLALLAGMLPAAVLASDGAGVIENDTVAATRNPFVDVSKGKYYYDAVLWAVENGITSGTSKTTFEPNATCTRGQVVTFLWRAAGSPEPTSTSHSFTDVNRNAYYYKAMLWAVEHGITAGTSRTTFEPNKKCTRDQVVTFLWRAACRPVAGIIYDGFTDVNKNTFYYEPVQWAVYWGVTAGTSSTKFSPKQPCTRGQVVTFLYRAMWMIPDTLDSRVSSTMYHYILRNGYSYAYACSLDMNGDGVEETLASPNFVDVNSYEYNSYVCSSATILSYQKGEVKELGLINELGGLYPLTAVKSGKGYDVFCWWGGSGRNTYTIYHLSPSNQLTVTHYKAESTTGGRVYTCYTNGVPRSITKYEFDNTFASLEAKGQPLSFECKLSDGY